MSDEIFDAIESLRRRFGGDLTIVGHHYQEEAVIRHTDMRGDSLELARRCAAMEKRWIMFCGVYFMAESAALLARPGTQVHLPEPSAECSMALMSPGARVEAVLGRLSRGGRTIIPLAYVNSTLEVKAVVGRHGGSVCTSANARTMLSWALDRGDAVLFLPDRNLGWNTADLLGLPESERLLLSVAKDGAGIDPDEAARARLLLWPGFCSIHTRFTTRQIERLRSEHPGAKIVVHPECTPEVAAAADAAGSTSFIIRYADEMPDGGVLVIGTEINLVERLARAHRQRLTILPLVESACTHMAQTTEERLLAALEALALAEEEGGESPFMVRIDESIKEPAREALERMLAACS